MQVEFVGGPKKVIENKIKEFFKDSDKISIAVAFLESSGVATIRQSIEETKKNKASISIITGLDFGITAPEALQELRNLDVECNIIRNENFHPKLYIFERGNEATVIIGSSNLSKGGLSTNYEANLILSGNISESPINEVFEYFSYLYSKSALLDDKIIELYSKRKNLSDEIKNSVNKDERLQKVTDELKEYLNQKVSFAEVDLTKSEHEELLQAKNKYDEGWNLYEIGKMNDAYNLFKESYDIYNKLTTVHSYFEDFLIGKTNDLLGMGWVLYLLYKFQDAKKCTDEAEKIACLIENKEFLLEALGLGALILEQIWDASTPQLIAEANQKCDKFIVTYESNKDNLEYQNYDLIGNVYSTSAQSKFELKTNLNEAFRRSNYAIKYLENADLLNDFDSMIRHSNIARAYIVKNDLKPEPDFDNNNVINHYNKALAIARNQIKSKFWEANIRIDFVGAYMYQTEKCDHLNKAKKIFIELGHNEMVKEINELIRDFGCK